MKMGNEEGRMQEDVEFRLVFLCCQGSPPPLRTWRKAVFSAVYPVNEQELHMSFVAGRDTQNHGWRLRFCHPHAVLNPNTCGDYRFSHILWLVNTN